MVNYCPRIASEASPSTFVNCAQRVSARNPYSWGYLPGYRRRMPPSKYDGMTRVVTDAEGGVVLAGNERRRFAIEELRDGRLLLHLVGFDNEAQDAYDNDPELQEMLSAAARSCTTVHQGRRPRRKSE